MYRCAFCGMQFTEEQGINACGSCPISNCHLVKCPNCGYESMPEAKSLSLLKKLFSKRKSKNRVNDE
ncbi:MAG: hypothetical protein K9I68_04675 [Bacteroidales bacterium]|nr:hypothetical protein [Bacteroidales bacterium]